MVNSDTKLSLRSKSIYFLGFIPDVVMSNLITSLALMIYKVELGVPAALIGLAIALPRLWEAFTDPIIGSLSDRFRSRWGRRRPFLAVGAVAAGLLCMALWAPVSGLAGLGNIVAWVSSWFGLAYSPSTEMSTNALFWWFLIASVLYLTAYAAYNVPYQALGLEMASSDRDRSSLAGFRAAANNFSWIVILPFLPLLVTNGQLGDSPVESVEVLGVLLGLLIIILGLTAAVSSREPPPMATTTTTTSHHQGPGLIAGIKVALSDRAFLMVTGIMCFSLIGFVLAMTLPYFVNLAIVFPGGTLEAKNNATTMSFWSSIIGNVLAMGFCPLISPLAERFGRKRMLLIGLGILMCSFLATPILFSHHWPWLQLIYKIVDTPAIAIVWVLTMPMLAEVCDRDSLLHGVSRQGVFTAMFNWGNKAAMALVAVLSGLVIDWSGFDGKLAFQTPETISYLRWMFVVGPLPFLAAAMWFTIRFPLNAQTIQTLRQSSTPTP